MEALEVLREVMRRGSYAKAALARGVDPSSISRTILGLEDQLGIRLFQRTTRRLSPTEAGAVYFQRMEPLLEEFESARLEALDIDRHPRGTLRIAAPASFAQLNLVEPLAELAKLYPELSFDLILTDAALDLVAERIDVAVRLGPLAPSQLVAVRLASMRGSVCASPAYLAEHARPRRPKDLAFHKCMLLDMPGFDSIWRFESSKGKREEIAVSGRLRSSNAIALKQFALAGLGVALLARWISGRELEEGQLIDLFPRYEVTSANFDHPAVWILYPSRAYLPLKVRVLIDYLKARFARRSPWEQVGGRE